MSSQGLDALAALASVVPSQATNTENGTLGDTTATGSTPGVQGAIDLNKNGQLPGFVPSSTGTLSGSSAPATQLTGLVNNNNNINSQQWQQLQTLLSAASGTTMQNQNQATLAASDLAVLAGLMPAPAPQAADTSALRALQQMNFINFLVAQQNIQTLSPTNVGLSQAQALQLTLSGAARASLLQQQDCRHQVLPSVPAVGQTIQQAAASQTSAMMPPPKPTAQPILVSTASIPSPSPQHQPSIAPQPIGSTATGSLFDEWNANYEAKTHDKKTQKRAANRRSAQLSRKRKKVYIEDLKEENDDLRRKEQILKSIPDLVVVFDSSGQLWFVSESVKTFLSFTAAELEGTSFWDRLCHDSVRLLKAAFMDSLAARKLDSETAPLGSGVWELRLVDKDGSTKTVTLSGVVHFAGERPECVCSLRPREESPETEELDGKTESGMTKERANSSVSFSRSLMRVHPQQSVISSCSFSDGRKMSRKRPRGVLGKRGEAVRISDSGNSSVESESGSSDETTGVAS